MKSGEQSILEVNRDVRRALVMHWIDLGRLSVHTQKDRVHIRGSLHKLPGADSPLTPSSVDVIYKKIKAAAGMRRVHIELDNWNFNSATGTWEPYASRDKRVADSMQKFTDGPPQSSFKLEE